MSDLFGEEGRKAIKNWVEKYTSDKHDYKRIENLTELAAAKSIIMSFLGDKWWFIAAKELQGDKVETLSDELSALSYYLDKQPEKYIRIAYFALLIKELLGKSNVLQKLKHYSKQGIRKKISKDLFDSTFFELKMAHYYASRGFKIEFIKESTITPLPDFKILSKNGYTYVECKKKRTKKQYSINGILDSINTAYKQLKSVNDIGIIAVELFLVNGDKTNLKTIFDKIQTHITKLPLVQFVIIVGEYLTEENEKIVLKTKTRTLENPYCKSEIPKPILQATIKFEPPKKRLGSLLVGWRMEKMDVGYDWSKEV